MNVAVIMVTHNSARYLEKAMECLQKQTLFPRQIIIIDSGSYDTEYLFRYNQHENITLMLSKRNIGFCQANNLGMTLVNSECNYILFLNPDTFLSPTFIEGAFAFMEDPNNKRCGALTGTLLGYDIDSGTPTGRYDSTGIFHTWYGNWFDRAQGQECSTQAFTTQENVPAICGALMFCRKSALESILINEKEVFDNKFGMYKEDIDLSCRLRKAKWLLTHCPHLSAYHCRGWNRNRALVPHHLRVLSARNELRLHMRLKSPIKTLYSFAKYSVVNWLDV